MAEVTIKQLDELERYQGEFLSGQQFYYAGKSLGVSAWGMNIVEMPAGWDQYPEHDHLKDGQEEVYIVLRGSGRLTAEGKIWELNQGAMVRVGAATKRKLVPGPSGLTVLALGGTPSKAYEPPSWWKK